MSASTKKTRRMDLSCDRGKGKKYSNTVESAASIYLWRHPSQQRCHLSSPWKMSKVQKKEEGRRFTPHWTWVLKHFIQWGVMLKREKVLFCSPQGRESSYRGRGFRSQGGGPDSRGWPPPGGAVQTRRQSVPFRASLSPGRGSADSVISAQGGWPLHSAAFQFWDSTYLRCLCQAGFVQHCQERGELL